MRLTRFAGAVVALAVGGVGALVLAGPVQATATECETVLHADLDGIETTDSPTVELGDTGVLVETTTFSGEGAVWWHTLAEPVSLAGVWNLSYDVTLQQSAFAGGSGAGVGPNLPAYLLRVKLGDGTEGTLVYEPYYSDQWGGGNHWADLNLLGVVQTWDAGAGKWWSSTPGLAGGTAGGAYASNQTLAQVVDDHPDIEVLAYGWQQTWAAGLRAVTNYVTFDAEYDCVTHAWTAPGPQPEPGVEFADHCDGILVHLSNGGEADAVFTVSGVDETYALAPGLEPEPLLVAADEVTVTEETTGQEWTHERTGPDDCDEPAGDSTDEQARGELPVTGNLARVLGAAGAFALVVGIAIVWITGGHRRPTNRPGR